MVSKKPHKKTEEESTSSVGFQEEKTISTKALSNQLNLILILILGIFAFNVYLFFRVQGIEQSGGGSAGTAGVPQESPLSIENLKAYAEELDLNTDEFNSCLDDGKYEDRVNADLELGAELGVQGTPGFLINGRFLGGAFPFENFSEIIEKELDGTATGDCSDYSEDLQQYCEDPENGPFRPEPVEVSVPDNTPIKGSEDAPITILEFSDFQCPFCTRAAGTVDEIAEAYPDKVKIYYMQFPLTNIHPEAFKASEASLCAYDQEKFWEYHDKLFEVQS